MPTRVLTMMMASCLAMAPAAMAESKGSGDASGGSAAPESGASVAAPPPAEPAEPGATGGAEYGSASGARASRPSRPVVRGSVARLRKDGTAAAPAMAPPAVQRAIWAANELIGKPYRYGGGHGRWKDTGYDCSGTISYALHAGRMLSSPLDSGSFMRWAAKGTGSWITVWTNPGHAFVVIAGLRLDTSPAGDPSGLRGPRWRPVLRDTNGFVARHPNRF